MGEPRHSTAASKKLTAQHAVPTGARRELASRGPAQAQAGGTALGHFNVADLVPLQAVVAAARDRQIRVLVGAPEGERDFAGTRLLAAPIRDSREEKDKP